MFKNLLKEMLREEFNKEFNITNNNNQEIANKENSIKILILQRGWVIVGNVRKENDYFISENSSVIRTWGTSKGLGEIALNGPTEKTKLDRCGTVRVHELTTVAMIDCDQNKWIDVLKGE